ncbi:MAG: FtsH protease activity modulator HflK [Gammaproteobacteria bacterium]
MVWKEPGKDKDPWNSAERSPELERVVKKLQQRLGRLFHAKPGNRPHRFHVATLWWVVPVIVAAWLLSGFYRVPAGERGVAFVFGRYQSVGEPGLHWHLPWPVGSSTLVSGVQGRDYTHTYTNLVTSDGNLVVVDASVHYHVTDLRDFLFNTAANTPGAAAGAGSSALLGELADNAIRTAVAHSTLEALLGSGRSAVGSAANTRLDELLKPYASGMGVTGLTLQRIALPAEVASGNAGVEDVQQKVGAQADAAHAYASQILAAAQSEADAEVRAAKVFQTTLVGQAQADTARFDAVLAAYRKAPEVTREELYLQTMKDILANADKVIVDSRDGRVTVQLGRPFTRAAAAASSVRAAGKSAAPSAATAVRKVQAVPSAISGGAEP